MGQQTGFLSKKRRRVLRGEEDDDGTTKGQIIDKLRMTFVDFLLLENFDQEDRAKIFRDKDTYDADDELVEQLLLNAQEYRTDVVSGDLDDRLPDLSGFGPQHQLEEILRSNELSKSEKRERLKNILSQTLKHDPSEDHIGKVNVGIRRLLRFVYLGWREQGMTPKDFASTLAYEIKEAEMEMDGAELEVGGKEWADWEVDVDIRVEKASEVDVEYAKGKLERGEELFPSETKALYSEGILVERRD